MRCTCSSVTKSGGSLHGDFKMRPLTLGDIGRWSGGWEWWYIRSKSFHVVGPVEHASQCGLEDWLVCTVELKDEIYKEFEP